MISSVVARFDIDSEKSTALRMLAEHPQIEIGELIEGRSIPIALEAIDHRELKKLHDWVESLPGVACLDVVFVCFDSVHSQT